MDMLLPQKFGEREEMEQVDPLRGIEDNLEQLSIGTSRSVVRSVLVNQITASELEDKENEGPGNVCVYLPDQITVINNSEDVINKCDMNDIKEKDVELSTENVVLTSIDASVDTSDAIHVLNFVTENEDSIYFDVSNIPP